METESLPSTARRFSQGRAFKLRSRRHSQCRGEKTADSQGMQAEGGRVRKGLGEEENYKPLGSLQAEGMWEGRRRRTRTEGPGSETRWGKPITSGTVKRKGLMEVSKEALVQESQGTTVPRILWGSYTHSPNSWTLARRCSLLKKTHNQLPVFKVIQEGGMFREVSPEIYMRWIHWQKAGPLMDCFVCNQLAGSPGAPAASSRHFLTLRRPLSSPCSAITF